MRRLNFTEKQSNVGINSRAVGALSMGILPTKTAAVQCYLVTFDIIAKSEAYLMEIFQAHLHKDSHGTLSPSLSSLVRRHWIR
jgi:hypothetical protein